MKKQIKKILMGVGGIALLGIGLLGGATLFPNEVPYEVEKIVTEYVNVPGDTVYEVKETIKEVEVITEVVGDEFQTVYDYMYDMEGDMTEVMDDLDDDEIDLLAERVFDINEAKIVAVNHVKAELFDEIDGEELGTVEFDEDDLKKLRIDDDFDELLISDADFEDKEFDVTITGTFKQDDIKYGFEAVVNTEKGYVDDMEVVISSLE